MRDKLTELIESSRYWGAGTSAEIADHLIANNVILLPEQMKDSWELALPFMMRLFVAEEAEIEKIKREFELKEVKKMLTDIRDFLAKKQKEIEKSEINVIVKEVALVIFDAEIEVLKDYAKKLGVEL